jgi:hypothetical protein
MLVAAPWKFEKKWLAEGVANVVPRSRVEIEFKLPEDHDQISWCREDI